MFMMIVTGYQPLITNSNDNDESLITLNEVIVDEH